MAKLGTACPICRKPARRAKAAAGGNIEIVCAGCGQFQASETFRRAATRHPVGIRRNALEKAKMRAGYGSLPALTTYDLP